MTHIALSPEFGLGADDFIATWNARPDCCKHGKAAVESSASPQFEVFSTSAVLISIGVGLVTSALYDLIKRALRDKGIEPASVEIIEISQPDGTPLLVVKRTI
jgi:hypothetical protein